MQALHAAKNPSLKAKQSVLEIGKSYKTIQGHKVTIIGIMRSGAVVAIIESPLGLLADAVTVYDPKTGMHYDPRFEERNLTGEEWVDEKESH
jgi:hypothetical protein